MCLKCGVLKPPSHRSRLLLVEVHTEPGQRGRELVECYKPSSGLIVMRRDKPSKLIKRHGVGVRSFEDMWVQGVKRKGIKELSSKVGYA